jgi:two-component system chemotaxis response regulator CheY
MSTRIVLVAEDSPVIRKLVGICLRGMDLEIAEVEDGVTAVDVAISTQPDVMLLDVGLPGKDGWTVLRDLRAVPATAELPILMLTGHAADADRRKAEAIGVSGFMTKPFQPAELRAAIAGLLPVDHAVSMQRPG